MTGVIKEKTFRWRRPLTLTRGYPSLTYLSTITDELAKNDITVEAATLSNHQTLESEERQILWQMAERFGGVR